MVAPLHEPLSTLHGDLTERVKAYAGQSGAANDSRLKEELLVVH